MILTSDPKLYEDQTGVGSNDPVEQRIRTVIKKFDDQALIKIDEIIAAITGGVSGTPVNAAGSEVTIAAGTPKTILTSTVPALKTRTLKQVVVTTRAAGSFEIKVGATVIGSGRTNAANLNDSFKYSAGFIIAAAGIITVDFTMLYGPIGQDVEVYLMATDI